MSRHSARLALAGDMNRRIRRRLGEEWPGYVEYTEKGGFLVYGWPWPNEPPGAVHHLFSTIALGHHHAAAAPRLTALIMEAKGVNPWVEVWTLLRDTVLPLVVSAAASRWSRDA